MIRKLCLSSERDWLSELESVGADPGAWSRVRLRSEVMVLKAGPFPAPAANILKQCMLSAGGDAIVARGAIDCTVRETPAILIGTPKHIGLAADSLSGQPFGLSELGEQLKLALGPQQLPSSLRLKPGDLSYTNGPLVMGVLNVTPDSFSDGGLYSSPVRAIERAMEMLGQGAAVVDIGAESTRPGSSPVPPEVQIERLLPVIRGICDRAPSAILSVDTNSSTVAAAALDAGVSMVNDVTALSDPGMASLAASCGCPIVLMHMKGIPADMQDSPCYSDVAGEVYSFLEDRVAKAEAAGMTRDRILVDPGIGFGKRLEDNLDILRRLAEFKTLGRPIVVGASRKRFIENITGLPVEERLESSIGAACAAALNGANIIRCHDVMETKRALQIVDAIKSQGRPTE
jgi:dihydropteroate synthase